LTTAIPHQPDPSSHAEPEDRRVTWLFAFLFLPIAGVPVAVWAATVISNPDLNPFAPEAFRTALIWLGVTTGVASFGSVTVLLTPRLAAWFGLPNWTRPTDERDRRIFHRAVTVAYLTSNVAVIVAALFAAYASPVVTATLLVVLLVNNTAFYLSYIVLSRRT
jgi:hypothetical protein